MSNISTLAIAYHSECGKIIDEEFFKGNKTHNIPNIISKGKDWQEHVIIKLGAISYPNVLSISTIHNFLNFLNNNLRNKDEFYIRELKIDFSHLSFPQNNFTKNLEPHIEIDLIKVERKNGRYILEVFEIKYSNAIKEYQIFQAGFYIYILKQLFRSISYVEIRDKINVIYNKVANSKEGYGLFEKSLGDVETYIDSSFKNIQNIYDKKNSKPLFLNPLCAFRRCTFFDKCYEDNLRYRGISFFKSLKKERRKLFISYGIDRANTLNIFSLPNIKVYRPAYFLEKYLTKKYGFWDYKRMGVRNLKVIKLGYSEISCENIAYVDLIYKDAEPWAIVLVLLLNPEILKSKDLNNYEHNIFCINGDTKYMYAFLFYWHGCFQSYSWLKFRDIISSVGENLTVVYLNEEAKYRLSYLIDEGLEFYLNLKDFNNLQKSINLRKILLVEDKEFASKKRLDNLILENELINVYMTNEPYSYKLPSIFAINRGYKFRTINNYSLSVNVLCNDLEVKHLNVNINTVDKLIKSVYSPVLPYDITVFYDGDKDKIKQLENFAVITGVETSLLLNGGM